MWIKQYKNCLAMISKAVLFCLILGLVMIKTSDVLRLQDDTYTTYGFDQFYDLPKDSVDVVMFGASGMREFYNVNEAYAHNGIACVNMATSNQPFYSVKYLIEEVEKTQHPSLYVIDVRELETNDREDYLSDVRRVADSMHFNKTRLDYIKRAFELWTRMESGTEESEAAYGLTDENPIDYIFSYFLYHNRWDELTSRDFGQYGDVSWMAFSIFTSVDVQQSAPSPLSAYKELRLLTDAHQAQMEEVLTYCQELHDSRGTEFLFLDSIMWGEDRHYERANTIKQAVESSGFTFIDTREWFDAMGFNLSTDFRDSMHVNVWGSFKYTDYLADYLQQTYGLADRRGNETYNTWQENYEGFMSAFNAMEAQRAAAAETATE